jgi:hypothetical protein
MAIPNHNHVASTQTMLDTPLSSQLSIPRIAGKRPQILQRFGFVQHHFDAASQISRRRSPSFARMDKAEPYRTGLTKRTPPGMGALAS